MNRNYIRRARPLLGTVVEIGVQSSLSDQSMDAAQAAINFAFKKIEKVQALMSFHDTQSDIIALNKHAYDHEVTVDPMTYRVIERALYFYNLSDKVFDISVATSLSLWGYLPSHPEFQSHVSVSPSDPRRLGDTGDIFLRPNNKIRFLKPLCIDLGGIAKGFAVDCAVSVLQAHNVPGGIINAGGDIRVFGQAIEPIHIRTPNGEKYLPLLELQNQALATSSVARTKKQLQDQWVAPIVDGRTKQPILDDISISVSASTAMDADALTKIMIQPGVDHASILRSCNATCYRVSGDQIDYSS